MCQRNYEIRRLPRHFKAKCVSQIQKTRFEIKVSTGQLPKAHIQQHRRMVEKEKMECFKLASSESRPDLTFKRAAICNCKKNSCNPKSIAVEVWQKLPADWCKKLVDGSKKP